MRKRLFILDLDGTLIQGHVDRPDPDGPFRQVLPFAEVRPLPGRAGVLARLADRGDHVAVATNKAGVAFGHQTIDECKAKRRAVIDAFDLGDLWAAAAPRRMSWHEAYCHPEARIAEYRRDDFLRKPRPGMLYKAMLRHRATADETIMVGDMEADRLAARAAGVDFMLADFFFDTWFWEDDDARD